MEPTVATDLRPVALKWMNDADRRPQKKWDLDKYRQQKYLSNFFDQSSAFVGEEKGEEESKEETLAQSEPGSVFSVHEAWDDSD